jgi:mono/diheme cytochrome c family protein
MLTVLAPLALSGCDGSVEPGAVTIPAEDAAALFERHCAICHADDGSGHGLRRRSLHRKPPDFRRPSWRSEQSLASVRRAIREGKPVSDMPAWTQLDEAEITGLARYVLDFGREDRRERRSDTRDPGP